MNNTLYTLIYILYGVSFTLLFFVNTEFIGLALLFIAHFIASVLMITEMFTKPTSDVYDNPIYKMEFDLKTLYSVFEMGECENIKIPVTWIVVFILLLQFISIIIVVTVISKLYFKYIINGDTVTFPKRVRDDLTNYEGWFAFGTFNAFGLLNIPTLAYYLKYPKTIKKFLLGFSIETIFVALYLTYMSYVIFRDMNNVII